MESIFNTYAVQMLAESELQQLKMDESLPTTHAKTKTILDEAERLRQQCGKDMQTDDRMILAIRFALTGVTWAAPVITTFEMRAPAEKTYEHLRNFLLHAAVSDDRENARLGNGKSVYFGTGYENRRLAYSRKPSSSGYSGKRFQCPKFTGTVKKFQSRGNRRQNPIDRRTGKVAVCRSEGCGSTEHFQFSGRCPVQRQREASGQSAAYMAQCFDEDPDKFMAELFFSKAQDDEDAGQTDAHETDIDAQISGPCLDDIFFLDIEDDNATSNQNFVSTDQLELDPFPGEWYDTTEAETLFVSHEIYSSNIVTDITEPEPRFGGESLHPLHPKVLIAKGEEGFLKDGWDLSNFYTDPSGKYIDFPVSYIDYPTALSPTIASSESDCFRPDDSSSDTGCWTEISDSESDALSVSDIDSEKWFECNSSATSEPETSTAGFQAPGF